MRMMSQTRSDHRSELCWTRATAISRHHPITPRPEQCSWQKSVSSRVYTAVYLELVDTYHTKFYRQLVSNFWQHLGIGQFVTGVTQVRGESAGSHYGYGSRVNPTDTALRTCLLSVFPCRRSPQTRHAMAGQWLRLVSCRDTR